MADWRALRRWYRDEWFALRRSYRRFRKDTTQSERAVGYLAALAFLLLSYTVLYNYGMATLEDRPQSMLHSLRVVVESFTTTGYGSDAPWDSPYMNLLTIAMQATGIIAIFSALPLFVVPLMEEALEAHAPTAMPGLSDHVVICGYTPHGKALTDELEARDVDYVVVESDPGTADDLYESGLSAVHGDPETASALANVNVADADAVVADAADETSASIILEVREQNPDVQVVSIIEHPENEDYHRYAGADEVLSPEGLLGERLADKVTTRVSAELGEVIELAQNYEVVELAIQRGSAVCDTTLAESGISQETGVSIVGVWDSGEFASPPPPDIELTEGTVLLAAGTEDRLEELVSMTRGAKRRHARNEVVVAGHGKVGTTVTDELAAADFPVTVIDIEDAPGVDVVGDATDEWTLQEAGIEDASTVIIALADDTDAVFTTLVVEELNPDIEVVGRANETDSVRKMYRAGADYVLALSTVSGRMLASTILDEEVMSFDTQVEVVRTAAPMLAGRTLAEADIRARVGCTVLAVERDRMVYTDLDPEFELEAGDELVVAGTDDDVNRFTAWANPEREGTEVRESVRDL